MTATRTSSGPQPAGAKEGGSFQEKSLPTHPLLVGPSGVQAAASPPPPAPAGTVAPTPPRGGPSDLLSCQGTSTLSPAPGDTQTASPRPLVPAPTPPMAPSSLDTEAPRTPTCVGAFDRLCSASRSLNNLSRRLLLLSHFIDEETEAQRGYVAFPRSQGQDVAFPTIYSRYV